MRVERLMRQARIRSLPSSLVRSSLQIFAFVASASAMSCQEESAIVPLERNTARGWKRAGSACRSA